MPYSALHKTITINLLNFIMFPEYETFHTTGILWNQQQQKVLSDDIEVHIVEIPKLMQQWRNKQINPWEDSFVRWLLLLPANEDEQLTQTLEDIAMNQDPILQKAMNKWERMKQGKKPSWMRLQNLHMLIMKERRGFKKGKRKELNKENYN
ncbi:Rpn family recombination-promoting nuclease/putative transposase [Bacillus thuringiensis]|nr:Rpn family recombination-promoting nuclease/putative transposase [Bacillus cereus]